MVGDPLELPGAGRRGEDHDGQEGQATVTQLTAVNDDLLAGKKLATAEEVWYTSSGGAKVQGWIVKPPDFDPGEEVPPPPRDPRRAAGDVLRGFDMMWQVFASAGYVVLYTNPRGSTGYGDAFVRAIEKAYPGVDYDDLMAGVDTVIGRGYVDTRRLYVSGCSGGGVLSSWVIGHTTRFAAPAVRCPVTNWISMAGQTDVPYFAYSFFDKPFWDDPTTWFKQSRAVVRGQGHHPDAADDRDPGPPDPDAADRGVLRGTAGAGGARPDCSGSRTSGTGPSRCRPTGCGRCCT